MLPPASLPRRALLHPQTLQVTAHPPALQAAKPGTEVKDEPHLLWEAMTEQQRELAQEEARRRPVLSSRGDALFPCPAAHRAAVCAARASAARVGYVAALRLGWV